MSDRNSSAVLWLLLALFVVLIVAASLVALVSPYGWGMMGGGGMMGWGIIFMAIPALVLILVLVAALGALNRPTGCACYPPPVPAQTPIQVLDERYARGEISREQYMQMRADLEARGYH